MPFLTFADALDSLMGYVGAGPSTQNRKDCLQAIDEAYRDFVNAHTWSYYYTVGRFICQVPFTQGVIDYQASGGAYPYQVTLVAGTAQWPSWAADGTIYSQGIACRVDRLISPTVVTLLSPLLPPADFTGQGYQLYQDSYLLPPDFTVGDQALYQQVFGALFWVHPREWAFSHRYYYQAGTPQFFTITSDVKYPGRLVMRLSPNPAQNQTMDFIYKRRPRPLAVESSSAGTISLAAGSSDVAGTQTAFTQAMVPWLPGQGGSVLRVSGNSQPPTWMPAGNPPIFEAQVDTVASPTSLSLMPLTPSPITVAAAPYTISDPIDIECGSMENAFLRCCEHKLSQKRIMKDKPDAKLQYLDELRRAREADSRTFAGRAEGQPAWSAQRMKDMPLGPDMS